VREEVAGGGGLGTEGEGWEEGGARRTHQGGGDRRRGHRAAAGVLLGHLQPAASRKGRERRRSAVGGKP
jgi:hypothetical protein